jgi:tetratricopeptide (TPR) repeat protein
VLTRRTWQAVGLWILVGVTTPAHAQTNPGGQAAPDPNAPVAAPSDQEQSNALDDEARERFSLGRTFYEAGRFQQAAEEFGEAYRLSGRPQLLYNLYVANRDAGNWQEATDALRGYLDKVPDAPDSITLRARLASLEMQNEKRKREQAEAESARKRATPPLTRREKIRSPVPLILTATGGALLVGSIVTGVMAKNKDDDLDTVCADGGKVCPEWRKDDANKAYSLAIGTDVLWTLGAATALTGIVLWWTGALDKERQVPIASVGVTQHGVSGALTVRY